MSVAVKRRLSMSTYCAVAQRRDDGGVGRGAADAVFLQRLDQRGLGEARRRLGEVLRRHDAGQLDPIALLHGRQHVIGIVLHGVVHAFLVDRDVARLDQGRAVGAQHGALSAPSAPAQHFDRDGVEDRGRHLAGDGALPDQRIQPELIRLELVLDVGRQRRSPRSGGSPRALPGRSSTWCLIDPRLFGEARLAVELHDDLADLRRWPPAPG